MNARLNIAKAAPEAYAAVAALDHYAVHDSGLEPRLVHLIKIRASQINGCAYCVDMHVKEARRDGLGEQWMHMISVWPESRAFTAEERAVLAWTDSLTRLPETGAADADFEPLREHFPMNRSPRSPWRSGRSMSGTASPSDSARNTPSTVGRKRPDRALSSRDTGWPG